VKKRNEDRKKTQREGEREDGADMPLELKPGMPMEKRRKPTKEKYRKKNTSGNKGIERVSDKRGEWFPRGTRDGINVAIEMSKNNY